VGLVKCDSRNFCLPSGEKIPWDTSRPIRVVVAADSAKSKLAINAVYKADNPAVFSVRKQTVTPLRLSQ
jgi:hypothetical protein